VRASRIFIELHEGVLVALRALRASPLRTVLTTLGIVVGVTAVIAIMSLIQGLTRTFEREVASLGTNVLYVNKFSWVSMGDFWRYRNRKNITLRQAEELVAGLELPAASTISAGATTTVKWSERTATGVEIQGLTPEGRLVHGLDPTRGRFFTEIEARDRKQVIVLGYGVWQDLFNERDPLGKRVRVGRHAFTVIGVLPEEGSFMGMDRDTRCVVPMPTVLKLFGSRRSMGIEILAPSAEAIPLVEDEITGVMRRVRSLAPDEENDFAINRQEMLVDLFRSLTAALFAVLIGVASLSLLVGGIGIMNIMLVSVTERTREIGIRKSVGARRRDIMYQFMVESVVVSGVGGVIGMGLGLFTAFAVSHLSSLPAAAPIWAVVLGLAFSASVGLFFGIYPAAKAAGLDPIEALRYE